MIAAPIYGWGVAYLDDDGDWKLANVFYWEEEHAEEYVASWGGEWEGQPVQVELSCYIRAVVPPEED